MAVLLFPRIPEHIETGTSSPDAAHGKPPRRYPRDDDLPAAMRRPVALFGWLSEQRAGGELRELSAVSNDQWRLFFTVGPSAGFALTEWMKDRLPRDVASSEMLHGARIFGSVVGWMSTSDFAKF